MQYVIFQAKYHSEVNAAISACRESRWGLLDCSQCDLKVSSVTNRIPVPGQGAGGRIFAQVGAAAPDGVCSVAAGPEFRLCECIQFFSCSWPLKPNASEVASAINRKDLAVLQPFGVNSSEHS